jgi:ubiquitin carboxyl-terminal hydrolase 4/11
VGIISDREFGTNDDSNIADKYKEEINYDNVLGNNGKVASAYGSLMHQMFSSQCPTSTAPREFKNTIGRCFPSFSGYGQQDSQEFVGTLLDGLQEDLSRIHKKPYIEIPDSTDEMIGDPEAIAKLAAENWKIYKARNDSVIADLFAGTYKSTLICPVCDKVSIKFDPFNNLTLQLPIENLWIKTIQYFPLYSPPVDIEVEMDKNGSIHDLKKYISQRVYVEASKLMAAETYRGKFFKIHDDKDSVSEAINAKNDECAIYEIEDVPTNFPAPKKKRSMLGDEFDDIPDWKSPIAEKMIVPVFHRYPLDNRYGQPRYKIFAQPNFILLTSEEARDFDVIQQKCISQAQNMTDRDLFEGLEPESDEGSNSTQEDTDMITASDAESNAASKVHIESVDGEEGLVDISMKNDETVSVVPDNISVEEQRKKLFGKKPSMFDPTTFISDDLRDIFKIKYFKDSMNVVPSGWNSLKDESEYPLVKSRIPQPPFSPASSVASEPHGFQAPGEEVSSDEDEISVVPLEHVYVGNQQVEAESEEDLPSVIGRPAYSNTHKSKTYSRKGKKTVGYSSVDSEEPQQDAGPLIRLSEGIILDWEKLAYERYFQDPKDDVGMFGGHRTFEIDQHPLLPDPELRAKQNARRTRRARGISLDDCLNELSKKEILSENDAWYCPRCKEHRRASKEMQLWKTPDILIIHLKRFSANRISRDKIDALVDFPTEGLDLTQRVGLHEDGKPALYDLFAVDNHYGGLGGGHYTANAKNFLNNKWYSYDGMYFHTV